MEKLIIPKKVKAGFNRRQDTYSGKLAYVIYHDGKVWRKENSWESWREKEATEEQIRENLEYYNENYHKKNPAYYKEITDHELLTKYCLKHRNLQIGVEPLEFDNVPTEGFVLNKKVGGYASDWGNFRQAYSRVFDPRGFEIEISVPNLLYILEHTNSIKGKGLEGKFVYSWDKKDLVLLPVDSPDYEKCIEFTEMQKNKISAKDLIPGVTYVTKQRKNCVYLGKFNWHVFEYARDQDAYSYKMKISKKHIFYFRDSNYFHTQDSINNLSHSVTNDVVLDYADLMSKLDERKEMHKIESLVYEKKYLEIPEYKEDIRNSSYICSFYKKMDEKCFVKYNLTFEIDSRYNSKENKYDVKFLGYGLTKVEEVCYENGVLYKKYIQNNNSFFIRYNYNKEVFTKEQVLSNEFVDVYFVLDNGNKIDINNY